MLRTLNLCALILLMTCGFPGCTAAPQPMIVLMPTYSHHRDDFDATADETPVRFDSVAAVE